MKVLLINGSPNANGSTYTALNEVAMKSIELGKKELGLPEREERVFTNFIR